MLTEEQITDAADAYSIKYLHLDKISFFRGATWANEQNAQEIAELKDNIRNLNITIENAAEWSEKQAAEIAELVDALRKAHFRLEKGFEYSDPDIVAILAKYEK